MILTVLAAAAGAAGLLAPPAAAEPVATVNAGSSIDAESGWVVWNRQADDATWQLVGRHEGTDRVLATARHELEVDLGTDKAGGPVATFSRCQVRGQALTGCSVRVLSLATGTERAAGIARPAGASDSAPSMHRGRIAFARRASGWKVDRLLLWSGGRRTVRLAGGTTAEANCGGASSCPAPVRGKASALDLGARLLAYRWDTQGVGVEVRSAPLDGGRSLKLRGTFAAEDCDGTDAVDPDLDGTTVRWAVRVYACEAPDTSVLESAVGRSPVKVLQEPVGTEAVVAFAQDGGVRYLLRKPPTGEGDVVRCLASAPCTLEAVPAVPAG